VCVCAGPDLAVGAAQPAVVSTGSQSNAATVATVATVAVVLVVAVVAVMVRSRYTKRTAAESYDMAAAAQAINGLEWEDEFIRPAVTK